MQQQGLQSVSEVKRLYERCMCSPINAVHLSSTPSPSSTANIRSYRTKKKLRRLFPRPLALASATAIPTDLISGKLQRLELSGGPSHTLVRYQLSVVVIVFKYGGVYGGDWRNQKKLLDRMKMIQPLHGLFLAQHITAKVIYLVGTPDELKSALTESFSARKPAVINIKIDLYAGAESGRMQHKN
ncbi:hypothetical protein IFM89_025776 [Coptis chinensis]|uniref:Uncharacterized protein n=1 Tax=Coptis chinensis TaxID=261450 RepID=A0A835HXH4_9MAGN|nr:hypothetical protein IFM89_025776 [Coptis chinensis]